jgi:hypothetical protein
MLEVQVNVDKYIMELKQEESRLVEGLITSPSDSIEKYQQVVGKVQGIRYSIDTLMQQFSDE